MLFRVGIQAKYQIWCESDFPCAQDPGIPVCFIWEIPDPIDRYSPFALPIGLWLIIYNLFAKFDVRSSLHSDVILITTDERTDGQTSIAQMSFFRVDEMSRVSDQYLYALHTY